MRDPQPERAQGVRAHGRLVRAACTRCIFKDKPTDLFDGSEAGEVRIEGDVAGVDIHQSGQKEPATTLAVVRTDGGWYLERHALERLAKTRMSPGALSSGATWGRYSSIGTLRTRA